MEQIKKLPDLVKVIKADIGPLLGSNITVAVVNQEAELKYIDDAIQKFSDFIISFTKGNFELLSVGDHSLPLSGTNIAFFKVSNNALVILNSDKGPVGQLLAFKGRMQRYSLKLDELLASIPAVDEVKAPAKAAVRVPVLTVSIKSKKFGMEEAKVLHLVNGENTISDICEKTRLPQLKVDEILRKYQKKRWIKLKRVIIGVPEAPAKKPAKLPPSTIKEAAATPAVVAPPPVAPAPQPPVQPAAPPQPPSTYAVPAMAPAPETQSEEEIFSELVDFIDQTQPIGMPAPEPPAQPAIPSYPQPPSAPPPSPSTAPLNPASPQVSAQPAAVEMSEIEGEPVSEAVFDDLASFLDQTAPMDATAPQAPAESPPHVSGSSLLEGTEEGIKITTYPEQADPLQDRLERLSNILEETTETEPSAGVKSEVKIVGSKAICPHCKTHVIMMAKVCPNCQRALRTCPNCKSPITLFARICPSCGSLL